MRLKPMSTNSLAPAVESKSLGRRSLLSVGIWTALITAFHAKLNLGFNPFEHKVPGDAERRRMRIGFLPVTCHLTCPVTDFINRSLKHPLFEPLRFGAFPELKEAFLSGYTQGTFILAPMAMALREQGIPLKIVYLGHRDGTAMMVHKDSNIFKVEDLIGKRVAIPNRFSNQRLLVFKALRDRGLNVKDLTLLEIPPPDMPAALYAKAVDAISSGEPFMAQTQLDGYGRVLYLTKDVWPNFISCVLAVHEELIANRRQDVQALVDGIARSGKWLDAGMDHRMEASDFVSKNYYNQHPRLLRFVLSNPPDRVKYTNLRLAKREFEEIELLGKEGGILTGKSRFNDYADPSFSEHDETLTPYQWKASAKL